MYVYIAEFQIRNHFSLVATVYFTLRLIPAPDVNAWLKQWEREWEQQGQWPLTQVPHCLTSVRKCFARAPCMPDTGCSACQSSIPQLARCTDCQDAGTPGNDASWGLREVAQLLVGKMCHFNNRPGIREYPGPWWRLGHHLQWQSQCHQWLSV